MSSSLGPESQLKRSGSPHSVDDGAPPHSPRDSISTYSRPPSSLLIERPQSSASLVDRATDAQPECDALNSSPVSPTRRPSEPAALQPSFKVAQSSCSSLATTVDKEAVGVFIDHEPKRIPEEPKTPPEEPRNVSKHHFDGPRPIGDPGLCKPEHFRLKYPPPFYDRYSQPRQGSIEPFYTSNSIDVEKLLENYSEEGAQLVEFLTAQEQRRDEAYAPVAKAQKHAKATLAGFLREQRQRAGAIRTADGKMKGRLSLMRPPSPPPLTPTQQQVMRTLEVDLIGKMENVAINHGESEGAIAGFFTFNWDEADEEPPEKVRGLLKETGGLDLRLLQAPLVASHDLGEQSYLEGMTKQPHLSHYQGKLNEIRAKNRYAYKKGFWAHWQHEHPPSSNLEPSLETKPGPSSLDPTTDYVPDWFYIFQKHNVIDFWGNHPSSRFTQLLNTLRQLEAQCEMSKEPTPKWEKEWHEENPLWSTPLRRERGG